MVDGGSGAGATSTCRRGGGGGGGSIVGPASRRCSGGCGLGRLVRRLRRQGRQALCSARPASSSSSSSAASAALRGRQYDPLSYARNFDQSGFGDPDPGADAASLYYSYTFSSRFVLAPSSAPSSAALPVAAPAGLVVVASRPTATSH